MGKHNNTNSKERKVVDLIKEEPKTTETINTQETVVVKKSDLLKQQAYALKLEREVNNSQFQAVMKEIAEKENQVWKELRPILEQEAKEQQEKEASENTAELPNG